MTQFKKLHVTGGPHGKNMKVTLDGEPLTNAYRIELQAGVDDAVRIHVSYIMITMDPVEVEGVVEHRVLLKRASPETDEYAYVEAVGDSLAKAIRTLADTLEAEPGPVH